MDRTFFTANAYTEFGGAAGLVSATVSYSVCAILKVPPINSPREAVQAAIASGRQR